VHVETLVGELVAQLTGVHRFEIGTAITLYFAASQAYVFDASERLAVSPEWRKNQGGR
ncbi:MAG: ABC transporter, partial [Variovorax sp.]